MSPLLLIFTNLFSWDILGFQYAQIEVRCGSSYLRKLKQEDCYEPEDSLSYTIRAVLSQKLNMFTQNSYVSKL